MLDPRSYESWLEKRGGLNTADEIVLDLLAQTSGPLTKTQLYDLAQVGKEALRASITKLGGLGLIMVQRNGRTDELAITSSGWGALAPLHALRQQQHRQDAQRYACDREREMAEGFVRGNPQVVIEMDQFFGYEPHPPAPDYARTLRGQVLTTARIYLEAHGTLDVAAWYAAYPVPGLPEALDALVNERASAPHIAPGP